MSSELKQKQQKFPYLFSLLIIWIYDELGYTVAFGDGKRDSRVFGEWGEKKGYGRKYSNHKLKLAHDIDLFVGGIYQTATEAHKKIGEKWESMDPDCRWGGHFNDGNHYSLEYRGRQ